MEVKIKTIFSVDELKQLPLFFRYMTEYETENVAELKVGARFSRCEKHFSNNYLQYNSHKPAGEIDLSSLFKSEK